MKLIVGLGNPGKNYENTRHNIGFMVIDNFVNEKKLGFPREKDNGLYYEYNYKNEKVILLKPQSYMNLSGQVIKKYVDFFKIDINNLLIISDDMDMPTGKIKLRPQGSSGGHNGLKNIEENLKTQQYKRLKIGIDKIPNYDTKDYVLGKFSKEEQEMIKKSIKISYSIIEDFLDISYDKLMNKYN